MKIASLFASALLGLGMLVSATNVSADPYPVGPPTCTANGCYQMVCDDSGCDLVFTPREPFQPREQMN